VVVANALRLLKLPAEVQARVRDGSLSVGHAKVILGLTGPAQQEMAADRVLKQGLNVRQTEVLVAHWQRQQENGLSARTGGAAVPVLRDVHVANLENKLRERLGTKVQLRYRQGKGTVDID